jgi:hypothetical protein
VRVGSTVPRRLQAVYFTKCYANIKVNFYLGLPNLALCHEDLRTNGCIDPRILAPPLGERPLPLIYPLDSMKCNVGLRSFREIRRGGMGWIYLTHNRDQWRALVNAEIRFRVHKMLANSLITERLTASQGLNSMGIVNEFVCSLYVCTSTIYITILQKMLTVIAIWGLEFVDPCAYICVGSSVCFGPH